MRAPIQYKVQNQQELILGYALREYYSAITSLAEIMDHFDVTRKYPNEAVSEFKKHVRHLGFQMRAYSTSKKINVDSLSIIEHDFKEFKKAREMFFEMQRIMKIQGFFSLNKTPTMSGAQKGKAIALGYG